MRIRNIVISESLPHPLYGGAELTNKGERVAYIRYFNWGSATPILLWSGNAEIDEVRLLSFAYSTMAGQWADGPYVVRITLEDGKEEFYTAQTGAEFVIRLEKRTSWKPVAVFGGLALVVAIAAIATKGRRS